MLWEPILPAECLKKPGQPECRAAWARAQEQKQKKARPPAWPLFCHPSTGIHPSDWRPPDGAALPLSTGWLLGWWPWATGACGKWRGRAHGRQRALCWQQQLPPSPSGSPHGSCGHYQECRDSSLAGGAGRLPGFEVNQVTSHKSQVTSHKSQVTSHKSQVTSHKSQVTSHKSQVTSHKSQVTSHKSQVTSHKSQVTSHKSTGSPTFLGEGRPASSQDFTGESRSAGSPAHTPS